MGSFAQLCPILCGSIDCGPPGSSVHGILQARILEWDAVSYARGSSWPKDRTCVFCVSCIDRWILYHQRHQFRGFLDKPNSDEREGTEIIDVAVYSFSHKDLTALALTAFLESESLDASCLFLTWVLCLEVCHATSVYALVLSYPALKGSSLPVQILLPTASFGLTCFT